RKYRGFWHRILHDQTADAIERDISQLPHANVTTVPFHIGPHGQPDDGLADADRATLVAAAATPSATGQRDGQERDDGRRHTVTTSIDGLADGLVPVGEVTWRSRVSVEGRVTTLRVQPGQGSHSLECVIEDPTGTVSLVFIGRRQIGGIECGTRLRASGTVSIYKGRLAIFNPIYTLL
ncbi:MAG: OB-fold nucleic acid binding domain-containing protein, partial [Acidimicrobiales bacterium]